MHSGAPTSETLERFSAIGGDDDEGPCSRPLTNVTRLIHDSRYGAMLSHTTKSYRGALQLQPCGLDTHSETLLDL